MGRNTLRKSYSAKFLEVDKTLREMWMSGVLVFHAGVGWAQLSVFVFPPNLCLRNPQTAVVARATDESAFFIGCVRKGSCVAVASNAKLSDGLLKYAIRTIACRICAIFEHNEGYRW